MKSLKGLKNRQAFTVVEILIVVVILGLLAAIVVPQITNPPAPTPGPMTDKVSVPFITFTSVDGEIKFEKSDILRFKARDGATLTGLNGDYRVDWLDNENWVICVGFESSQSWSSSGDPIRVLNLSDFIQRSQSRTITVVKPSDPRYAEICRENGWTSQPKNEQPAPDVK